MGVPCEGSARCEFVRDARRTYPSALSRETRPRARVDCHELLPCQARSSMLDELPGPLVQLVLADATKATLRAVAATCSAMLHEARSAANRSLVVCTPLEQAGGPSDAPSSDQQPVCVEAEVTLLHVGAQCDPNPDQTTHAVAEGIVEVVSSCAFLPDGTICLAVCAASKLIRMNRSGEVLGQLSLGSCWPRAIAVTPNAIFVTSMPADVNVEEAPDHPSSRVTRIAWSTLLNAGPGAPAVPVDGVELHWCHLDAPTDDEGEEDDAADDTLWGECRPDSAPGVPIALTAAAERLFVLHRIAQVGARPWEYMDDEWEESPSWGSDEDEERLGRPPNAPMGLSMRMQRGRRARPVREHFVSVFEGAATRARTVFSIGEWARNKAPDGLVAYDRLLYISQHRFISVVDAKGQPVRIFRLEQPQSALKQAAAGRGLLAEILEFAIANGRVYSRDSENIRVCDLDGKLMQSVALSPRSLTRKLDPQWQQSGSRRQMAMSCHENGLLVDADRLITFMHASTDRDLMHSAYLSAAKRALGMRSVNLVA